MIVMLWFDESHSPALGSSNHFPIFSALHLTISRYDSCRGWNAHCPCTWAVGQMNRRVFVEGFANNTPHTIAVLQWTKALQCKSVVVDSQTTARRDFVSTPRKHSNSDGDVPRKGRSV